MKTHCLSEEEFTNLKSISVKENNKESLVRQLADLINQNLDYLFEVNNIEDKTKPLAILFSGGLDSSLVAWLLYQCGFKLDLYASSHPGCSDEVFIQKFAELTNSNLEVISYSQGEVDDYLENRINAADLYKVAFGLLVEPLYERMKEDRHKMFFSGWAADLIFSGGHNKDRWEGEGDKWRENYWRETLGVWRWRFIDNPKESSEDLEELCPLFSFDILKLARGTDPLFNWQGDSDKVLLREAALSLGLPEEFVYRPKDPAQNSSGIFSLIESHMKRNIDDYTSYAVSHHPKSQDYTNLRLWAALMAARRGVRGDKSNLPEREDF